MQIAKTDAPIIEVQHLYKDFPINSNAIKSGKMRALSDITFNLHRGRALAVVGESGPQEHHRQDHRQDVQAQCRAHPLSRPRSGGVQQGHRPVGLSPERADGVARSVRFAQPDPHHLSPHRPSPAAAQQGDRQKELPDMVYALLEKVGLTPPKQRRPSIRTSSPAASASGSTSPAIWQWRRRLCWRTSRLPCSTSPFASASST